MAKSGMSLFLLWLLWSTISLLGFGDAISDGNALNVRKQGNGGIEVVEARWILMRRNDDEAPIPSTTAAPNLKDAALLNNYQFHNRQADSDDGPDDKPPPSGPIPGPPLAIVSNSVSSSVSTSVSNSMSSFFSSAFSDVLASSSRAVDSAHSAGFTEGLSLATMGAALPAGASITAGSFASELAEVQASASSSAQSAVEAANASASAVLASASSPSNLTPGQIAGIVVSIAFVSSFLSALATFLLMRRRLQRQEPEDKFEQDETPEPQMQDTVQPLPPPTSHYSVAHTLTQSMRNRLSSFYMFPATIASTHRRSRTSDYMPDAKLRVPPPTADHPAMSRSNTRPFSLSAFPIPVIPGSPTASEGGQSLFFPGHGSGSDDEEPHPGREITPSRIGRADDAATPKPRVSLARQQSMTSSQRPLLVRVGSNRERKSADLPVLDPICTDLGPVCTDTDYDVAPVSATGQCHIATEPHDDIHEHAHDHVHGLDWVDVPIHPGTPLSFQLQAPIPRRPIDPIDLEHGPNSQTFSY
ncbi:hypothetical protein F4804DRAFT_285418 [Jackrogersella minutella]|nr:hypothetical protein F4804DRAFT_285418 [Jackrogersella minutella]